MTLASRRLRGKAFGRRSTRIAWLFTRRVLDGEVATAASAMTFDLFLAAIPMLALAGWLLGRLVQQDNAAQVATSALLDLTPSEVRMLVWTQLQAFGLGTVAPLVLLGALWMASAAFHTSMSLLEMAVGAAPRAWWHKRLLSLAWVVCMIALFAVATWLSVQLAGGPERIFETLAWGQGFDFARVTHFFVLGLTLLLAVALLGTFYRTAVYRGAPRRVWPGVLLTTASGVAVSVAFAYYVQHLAKFAVFYGSLAAVAVVLGWLYLLCFVFLAGAELNVILEHEASLQTGQHPKASHKSVRESYTNEAAELQNTPASADGARQTPQPSGSSAEL